MACSPRTGRTGTAGRTGSDTRWAMTALLDKSGGCDGCVSYLAQGTTVKKSAWSCRLGGARDRTGIGPSAGRAGRH